MRSLYEEDIDDEGYLDDGDLPSLRPKGSYTTSSVGSSHQDNNNLDGLKSKATSSNDIDSDYAVHIVPARSQHSNGQIDDNDGPDDEMAARRAMKGQPDEHRPSKSYDTDNSVPTENESHLSDEEVQEEERYEETFCGQTLNVINDICGGNTASSSSEQRVQRKVGTTSSRSPKRDPPQGEIQQENTAIEVEYMEPIKQTMSAGSDDGAMSENTKRKNLRLNAIAKKAKEKFRNKKGKLPTPSVGSIATSGSAVPVLLQQAIDSTADDDDVSKNNNLEMNDVPTITNTVATTDLVDNDYTNFNAAEKRKFIKLINSGVVAAIATRQIIDERNEMNVPISDPVHEVDDEDIQEVLDDVPEDSNVDVDHANTVFPTDDIESNIVNIPTADNSFSSNSAVPFKKSGSLYYDAVRRDVDDSIDTSREVVDETTSSNAGRTGFIKGREFGVKQLLFGSGKPKGFAALQDTPEKRSSEIVNGIIDSENTEYIAGDGTMDNIHHVDKNKDVSLNTSFDSFVRNRIADDANGNVSVAVEDYQMTPTRDLVTTAERTSPESGASTMIDSYSAKVNASPVASVKINEVGDSVLSTPSTEIENSDVNGDIGDNSEVNLSATNNGNNSGVNLSATNNGDNSGVHISATSNESEFLDSLVANQLESSYNSGIPTSSPTIPEQETSYAHGDENDQNYSHSKESHHLSSINSDDKPVGTSGIDMSIDSNVPQKETSRSGGVANYQDKSYSKETNDLSTVKSDGKPATVPHMDMSVYSNVNNSLDLSHQNDAVSVFTNGTSVTGTTTYTQSSRLRRPGVAKTRLAKQKELEQNSAVKPQGWHKTIRAAAESSNRVWDPEKGWVDYVEPDISSSQVESLKKEKMRIELSKSLTQKETKGEKVADVVGAPGPSVPFPHEWEKERYSMIDRSLLNLSAIEPDEDTIDRSDRDKDREVTSNVLSFGTEINERSFDENVDSDWVKSMRIASAAVAKDGMVWDPRFGWKKKDENDMKTGHISNVSKTVTTILPTGEIPDTVDLDGPLVVENTRTLNPVQTSPASKLPSWMMKRSLIDATKKEMPAEKPLPLLPGKEPVVDDDGNVEFENLYNATSSAFETRSDLSNEDIIIVEGDDEASRNVIEVVKQKVSGDDLELFPSTSYKSEKNTESQVVAISPKATNVDTSLASIDPSNISSRRGAGPVDTDEVDETWDSEDDERHSKDWHSRSQENPVDFTDHHHIDGWKDNTSPASQYDSTNRILSTPGNNSNQGVRNVKSISPASSSRRIPKLERSKRDTSPLSLRNPLEVAFPRSEESIRRHENIEIEYTNKATTVHDDYTSDPIIEDPISKSSNVMQQAANVGQSEKKETYGDSHSVRARLKEWESRIESSHSSDNGDTIEKSKSVGLTPTAAAGWKSFLSKKVQTEKSNQEAQQSKSISLMNESKDRQPVHETSTSKTQQETFNKDLLQYTETIEASGLNLSDLSPIQAQDDASDDDIATSVGYGPTEEQRKSSSFFQRLTECTAPIIPSKASALCGSPDEVVESDSVADKSMTSGNSTEKHRRSMSYGDEKPKSSASPLVSNSKHRTSASSVVSEDFGAKTAFLDALAMKAAVSKPKRNSSSSSGRMHELSSGSSIVSGTTDHSEKWKMFLERKRASANGTIGVSQSDVDVSRVAEKYAAEKVEEIMSKMAARSKTTPRSRDYRNEFSNRANDDQQNAASVGGTNNKISQVDDGVAGGSISAAEDLAAARVEAMMAALVSTHVDEGEI